MKTYFPYQLKYIGVMCVLIAIILSCIGNIDDLVVGFRSGWADGSTLANDEKLEQTVKHTPYFNSDEKARYVNLSLLLSIAGFVLYLFSKEKIEDEFYQQLRGKCLTQALLITWLLSGFIYWIMPDYGLDGFYILQLHLIIYTVLYYHNEYNKYQVG